MINPMTLEGKRILVTGASSGIGRACAEMSAELGASVALVARRKELLEEVRSSMVEPTRHMCISVDLANRQEIGPMIKAVANVGRIDGIVHAAGIGPTRPLKLIDDDLMKSVFDTNYFSFIELMKHATGFKVRGSHMSVVAISSVAALSGWGGVVAYASSKGALSTSVRSLAMEFAANGVRVNAVCPSNIRTHMYEEGSLAMNDETSLKALLAKQPLGLGEPRQVASVVCFLLSEASSFITGVNLPVDGGYMAQ